MLSFLLTSLTTAELLPPFSRIDTIPLKGYSEPYQVEGNLLYIVERSEVLKIDLTNRKKTSLYKTEPNSWIRDLEVTKDSIYSIVYSRKTAKTTLQIHGKTSGKLIRTLPVDSNSRDLLISPSQIFVSVKPNTISGLDLKTLKTRWTAALNVNSDEKDFPESPQAITRSGQTLILDQGTTTVALNAVNGQLLWQLEKCYMFEPEFTTYKNLVFVPHNEGTVSKDLISGKTVWQKPKVGYSKGVFNDKLFALGDSMLYLLHPETGAILHEYKLDSDTNATGLEYATVIQNKLFYQGRPYAGIIGPNGAQVWETTASNQIAQPIWTDGKTVAGYNGSSISFYAANQSLDIPKGSAERSALAQKLCAGIESLSDAEQRILVELGDEAFLPLFNLIKHPPESFLAFPVDIYALLNQVTSHKQTEFLIKELKSTDQETESYLTIANLLAERGDPQKAASFFLNAVENPNDDLNLINENLEYFSRLIPLIKDPRAIAKSIQFLDDKNTPIEVRFSAFVNLPEVGGELGQAAVNRHRGQRGLIDPIEVRLQLSILEEKSDDNPSTLHQIATASNGRTYALFESPMLGGYTDLWIAERVDGKWVNPAFVGLSDPISTRSITKSENEIPNFAGKSAKELIAGAWISILPEHPEIYSDTDQDGLTDRLENRLGTNPKLADTDSDGDPDILDPWPTVAVRTPASEHDKIFLAAWDAFAFMEYNWLPGVFKFPDSASPFELPAWPGPMFLEGQMKFGKSEGNFLQEIVLSPGRLSENSNPYGIELSRDGQSASLEIGFNRGSFTTGNRYTLKKVSDQWYVIKVEMAWIS